MGPRRAIAGIVCALGALALVTAGCGAEEHANEPRAQPPTRVSIAISEDAVTVQPPRIALGPEPTKQIPQNSNTTQPPVDSDAPLDVVMVIANLTDFDSRLEVRGPAKDVTSGDLIANSSVTFQAELPTGVYTVSAADIPGAKPGRLVIGPYRTSSENDVLLP